MCRGPWDGNVRLSLYRINDEREGLLTTACQAARTNPVASSFRISCELWEVPEPLNPEYVNTHGKKGISNLCWHSAVVA